MNIKIISASGYKYQGPHNFNSAKAMWKMIQNILDEE